MKSMPTLAISAAAALMAISAAAAEKKIPLKDLPAAVQKTIQEETRNATLVGLEKEQDNGKTVYELETKVDGRTRDLTIDAEGKVIEVEEEMILSGVPAAARAAIEKAAAGGTIEQVEALTKGGATDYEASFTKGGKKSQIIVSSDGSVKKH